jgi:hypothetical protein
LSHGASQILKQISALAAASAVAGCHDGPLFVAARGSTSSWIDAARAKDWQARWERFFLDDAHKNRYCDTEMGEELGWVVSPFLEGFYYGYLATQDSKWVVMLIDWTDACIKRAVYRERREKWWQLMKSRMKLRDNRKYFV